MPLRTPQSMRVPSTTMDHELVRMTSVVRWKGLQYPVPLFLGPQESWFKKKKKKEKKRTKKKER